MGLFIQFVQQNDIERWMTSSLLWWIGSCSRDDTTAKDKRNDKNIPKKTWQGINQVELLLDAQLQFINSEGSQSFQLGFILGWLIQIMKAIRSSILSIGRDNKKRGGCLDQTRAQNTKTNKTLIFSKPAGIGLIMKDRCPGHVKLRPISCTIS